MNLPRTIPTMLASNIRARNGQSDLVEQNLPLAANTCTHFFCTGVRKGARAASVYTRARAYMLYRNGCVTKSRSLIFHDWDMDTLGIQFAGIISDANDNS